MQSLASKKRQRLFHFKRGCAAALLLAVLLWWPPALFAATILSGQVVRVADGDTITILPPGRQQVRIRLAEIDAPEKKQAFGQRAKDFTSSLVAGRVVSVQVRDLDRYGRVVGEVFLPDGRSVNRLLVENGFAWWYRQYSRDMSLGELEAKAKAERRGLWRDPNPMPPWEWRRQKRGRN